MKLKNHAKTLVAFVTGFICAGLLAAFLLTTQNAQATIPDSACCESPLNFNGFGIIRNPNIAVYYSIPSCLQVQGYKAVGATISGNRLLVTYTP